jgi:hypothetical protein
MPITNATQIRRDERKFVKKEHITTEKIKEVVFQ